MPMTQEDRGCYSPLQALRYGGRLMVRDGRGRAPTLELWCADDTAKCSAIDEVPKQGTCRSREATQLCAEDLRTQQRGNDGLRDAPEEPRPHHALEDGRFRKALGW